MNEWLDTDALERSWVVANNSMNRERQLQGGNSYTKDLRFDLLAFLRQRLESQASVTWVDLCCGTGVALIETAQILEAEGFSQRLRIIGVDLVAHFAPLAQPLPSLQLVVSPLRLWEPEEPCDLITCVHGLHYVGDKLAVIEKAAGGLRQDGLFLAHLDLNNLRHRQGTGLARRLKSFFQQANISYHSRHRILQIEGHRQLSFPCRYLGARDDAGPNYTGQPAVHSYYEWEK